MKAIRKATLFVYPILPDWEVNTMASFRKRGKTWTYVVNYTDSNGVRHQKTLGGFAKKKMAENAAAEVEHHLMQGADLNKQDTTLIEYWDRWIDLYKAGKHTRVTEARYATIRKELVDYFGTSRKLRTISKSDWQAFINHFATHRVKRIGNKKAIVNRSKDTVSKLNGYVRAMVNSAVDDQILYTNFTHDVVLSGDKGKAADLKYIQADDFDKLLKFCTGNAKLSKIYNYMIAFGILTGARYAEVGGLDWPNMDLDNAVVHIRHTWDYKFRTGFMPTKNPTSNRDIDISPQLVALLRQLKTEQEASNLATGYRDPYHLVFRNYRHELLSNGIVNRHLKDIEQKLGINPVITFHGLRHSHVAYLLAHGVDISYISKRLGHANVQITLRVYAHMLKDVELDQISATVKALSKL